MVSTLSSDTLPAANSDILSYSAQLSDICVDLGTYARELANGEPKSPGSWDDLLRDLAEGLLFIVDYIVANLKPEELAKPPDDILDIVSGYGFARRDDAETALRSCSHDLSRRLPKTWSRATPFVEWIFKASLSARKYRLGPAPK